MVGRCWIQKFQKMAKKTRYFQAKRHPGILNIDTPQNRHIQIGVTFSEPSCLKYQCQFSGVQQCLFRTPLCPSNHWGFYTDMAMKNTPFEDVFPIDIMASLQQQVEHFQSNSYIFRYVCETLAILRGIPKMMVCKRYLLSNMYVLGPLFSRYVLYFFPKSVLVSSCHNMAGFGGVSVIEI